MIKTKAELKEYLDKDKKALGIKKSRQSIIGDEFENLKQHYEWMSFTEIQKRTNLWRCFGNGVTDNSD